MKVNWLRNKYAHELSFRVTDLHVKEILSIVKEKVTMPIGFHGHNNIELALINAITAMENGATGGTILHGRGAGIYENSSLFSMAIEPEKEIILFLFPKTERLVIAPGKLKFFAKYS